MTKKAADTLFSKTGVSPQDVDVVELHDCFAANELITYEALGLCAPGMSQHGSITLNVHSEFQRCHRATSHDTSILHMC